MTTGRPKVYIVGGGFAGIEAAKALAKAPVDVTLVDRRNHHLFQPLLYEVATASLSPADIASPIRSVLRRQANCRVILAEITAVDIGKRRLDFDGGSVAYDYLILAAGATHSYFGHDDWARLAPGLKTVEDAREMRRRILLAFESAEYAGSEDAQRAALTFAIVGGGPTGVELAGAIREIALQTIPREYRHISTHTAQVILLEGDDRLLAGFPQELGERARQDLERMGVEVRLKARVTNITPEGIYVGQDFTRAHNVFWAAGVKASSLGSSLGVPLDRAGRVIVNPDLTIPGHPRVFITGDMAAAKSADTGEAVPGVAQGALQMGRYAGNTIASETSGRSSAMHRTPFSYHDKGMLATIGRAKAVARIGRLKFSGLLAWLIWAGVHITFLVSFRNRTQVLLGWFWNWVVNSRDARLITGDSRMHIDQHRPGESILAQENQRTSAPP